MQEPEMCAQSQNMGWDGYLGRYVGDLGGYVGGFTLLRAGLVLYGLLLLPLHTKPALPCTSSSWHSLHSTSVMSTVSCIQCILEEIISACACRYEVVSTKEHSTHPGGFCQLGFGNQNAVDSSRR